MAEKLSIEELLAAATTATKKKRKKPRPKMRKAISKSGGGYSYVWKGNKQVLKHRSMMEKELGRSLMSHEAVYFLDGNKENFALDNLQVGIKPGKFQTVICPHCKGKVL
jgi:hypothetical protein